MKNPEVERGRRASNFVRREPAAGVPIEDATAIRALLRRLGQSHPSTGDSVDLMRERVRHVRKIASNIFRNLGERRWLKEGGLRALAHFAEEDTEGHYAAKMLRAAEVQEALADQIELKNDGLAAHAFNQGAGMMVELFAWIIRYGYGPALVDGLARSTSRARGTENQKAKTEHILIAARTFIAQYPETNQGDCVAHVASLLDRDEGWVRKKVSVLFENDPDRRGKRPRRDLTQDLAIASP